MIKLTVMYPHTPGARFDHAYYRTRHMPLIQERMGAACLYYTIDKGLSGRTPGSPPLYEAVCHIYAESLATFEAGFAPHATEIRADLANYTDITPVTQFSEVVVEHS
ncbi:MAG: EthD family reductase [Kofleriaceae bacterium]